VQLLSELAGTAHVRVGALDTVDDFDITFTALAREDVFDVSISSTSVPADGFSSAVITVTLKRLGTIDQRAIKFETSAGFLVASGQVSARAVTITAGGTGRVIVELQSETIGIAHVRVTALDTLYEFDVTFVALAQAEVFDVSVSRTSIPADGFSTATITATLKRPGTAQQRVVKFETSAGLLIAPGQAAARAVTLTADATGIARVELQSDKTVGSARVRVTNLDLPFELTVAFTSADPASVVTVSTAPGSAPADGATAIIVSATVAAGLPAGRRTVAFRTTLGTVVPALVEADGSNVARASLVSFVTGSARITATVDGVTADTTAQFTPALPDRIVVAPDAVQLRSGGNTTIRVTLLRSSGSVSPRLEVSYSATTSTGSSLGSFSRVTLAEGSTSTAQFNVDTTSYVGPVTIRAAVNGTSGTASINIVP